ncbi:hypothetical protein A3C57_03245 [Candidatus Nomurabacteria bacterium RIFCSPHIGHO2_02_FULL_33_12]|uniref:Uncharacterized protein n=1 Tax=Candidatus Nomurabacteria bacterium RIFCSPLOWO2_01_FULL_33_17 TaxID=1801764 RepID=A0A1F6WQ74_9BACT|nr:MAG: hypothetical protein A3C57_03245 [Candidatus Nomurabacteria bacterium RIFCSPHIGHO2_02_FULL_33_12]OGI84006.1 MAG: hypothetical protein A2903_00360 [Candidatus Nomurabacteria bacterium RIFCSPLOWO2_01_FULL_33_17]
MKKSHFFKSISYFIVFSFFVYPISSFAITIANDPYNSTEDDSSSYKSTSGNYSGVADIGKATKDPAAKAALTSCNKAVPAAQRALLGLQYAKQDPTRNDTLLTIFNNIPALIGGASAVGSTWVKNPKYVSEEETSRLKELGAWDGSQKSESKFITNPAVKKEWKNYGSNAANVATFGISGKNQAKKAEAAGDTARLQELAEQETFRTECLDSIKISIAKNLLDRGTVEMVSLIQTGNFGDPMYVTDGEQWYKDMQNRTIVDVFGVDLNAISSGNNLSNPYAKSTIKNLINSSRGDTFQEKSYYTLGSTLLNIQNRYGTGTGVNNIRGDINSAYNRAKSEEDIRKEKEAVQAFNNDFNAGGWDAWLALTQNQANNPIGYSILASEELSKKQAEKEKAFQAENSNQLLSKKVCTSYYVDSDGKPISNNNTNRELDFAKIVNRKNIKINPNDPKACLKSEVVTPGSLITERMKWFVTSDIRQAELADKFNSSISTILTASINKATQIGLDEIKYKLSSRWNPDSFSSALGRYAANRSNFLNGGNKSRVSYQGVNYELFLDTNSSFWKSDFDLERDLNDVQIGCEINKGLYTTQKEYVDELEYMIDGTVSPLPQVIPYVALLDMCVPGPTPAWQELSDPFFAEYIDVVSEQNPDKLKSPDLAFTKINKLLAKKEKNSGTMATVGALTSSISSVLPPPANGIGMIVGAGLNIGSAIIKNKKIDGLTPSAYSSAINAFQQIVPQVMEEETYKNKDKEIEATIKAYEGYIDYIYTTYSDENNIPVAGKARPVIGNLMEKNENVNATIEAYNAEYPRALATLKELESIKKEVDAIYATARKRMSTKYPDTVDTTSKTSGKLMKWSDLPEACTQSCIAVKQKIEKPDYNEVQAILKGLKLTNGAWGSGKSLRQLHDEMILRIGNMKIENSPLDPGGVQPESGSTGGVKTGTGVSGDPRDQLFQNIKGGVYTGGVNNPIDPGGVINPSDIGVYTDSSNGSTIGSQ